MNGVKLKQMITKDGLRKKVYGVYFNLEWM